jgi:hypothetical protein
LIFGMTFGYSSYQKLKYIYFLFCCDLFFIKKIKHYLYFFSIYIFFWIKRVIKRCAKSQWCYLLRDGGINWQVLLFTKLLFHVKIMHIIHVKIRSPREVVAVEYIIRWTILQFSDTWLLLLLTKLLFHDSIAYNSGGNKVTERSSGC